MARVALENLTKIFTGLRGETIHAVNNASLTVEDKELLVLVGPSACGKTTTLRLIAGLDEATRGTISIDGHVVNRTPAKDRDVAMVFQNGALYPHMSARENMAFGLKLRGCPREEIDKRVREATAILDLDCCLDRKPEALSGGQRQRVALGRALVRRPSLFLFDEPLSSLDPQMRPRLRAEIRRLHSRFAATMLYVTHDQVEAMSLGNRIAVMKEGAIQQVAEPMCLYHQPANLFVAGFIGSPPMNFFRGSLVSEGNGLLFQEQLGNGADPARRMALRLEEAMALRGRGFTGKSVVLGIRPENMQRHLAEAPSEWRVEAITESIEPLGPETYLHLATAAHSFVARLLATDSGGANQKVSLLFDMSRAHLFDPKTGLAI